MNETVIQVDGKIVFVIPKKIIKSVCIPGKLVNLLTKTGDPDKLITCTEGVKGGKHFKRYKFGKKVKLPFDFWKWKSVKKRIKGS